MKKILLLIFGASLVCADDSPLSFQKKETLNLKRQQIEKDMYIQKNRWISPLIFSASLNKSDGSISGKSETQSAGVSWNQDLFQSGGIYYTIKNSKATAEANLLNVTREEASYLKQLYTLKAELERNKLKKEQNELTLRNMDIDLLIIKAKYKAGLADISQLNQATINRDNARTNLIIIKNALNSGLYELKKLTNSDSAEQIVLPKIELPSQEEYLNANLELLEYNKQDIAQESSWKKTRASYLPKLAFNGSYSLQDVKSDFRNENGTAYNYGLTLSMPLDLETFDTIESAKLQSMQIKSLQKDRRLELEQEYAKRTNNINDYLEKISVAQEMLDMYNELYSFTSKQVKTGFKSQYELESLGNSRKIQTLEQQVQRYNIAIEKIRLYFDTKH